MYLIKVFLYNYNDYFTKSESNFEITMHNILVLCSGPTTQ